MFLDDSARKRFGAYEVGDYREFYGQRLKIIGRSRGALSFTTMPIAFMDYRVTQSMVPQELQNRATYILVKLSPGADPERVRAADPPPSAAQRRLDPRRVGRTLARLLDRHDRSGTEHAHDRLSRVRRRGVGRGPDALHIDHSII